jgi:hypothetical protein
MSKLDRLLDEMLAAQSRFAAAWRDDRPLTKQQQRDEIIRDRCRSEILEIVAQR